QPRHADRVGHGEDASLLVRAHGGGGLRLAVRSRHLMRPSLYGRCRPYRAVAGARRAQAGTAARPARETAPGIHRLFTGDSENLRIVYAGRRNFRGGQPPMENGRQMESGEGSMKLIPVISPRPGGRRARRMPPLAVIAASLSVLFPLGAAALASPAAAGTAPASTAPASAAPAGTMAENRAWARTRAATPSCPWLNESLPISQRVHLLLSKMTLANEITMVEGQGTSQPYVFYMAAQPSLCIPAMGLEDGPLGVGDGLTGVTQLPSGASLAPPSPP